MRCRMIGRGSSLLQPAPSCFSNIRGAEFKRPIRSGAGAALSRFIDTFTTTNCTFLAITNRPKENWRFVVDFTGANLNAAAVRRNIHFCSWNNQINPILCMLHPLWYRFPAQNVSKRVEKFILFSSRTLFPPSEVYFKYLNKRWKMIPVIRVFCRGSEIYRGTICIALCPSLLSPSHPLFPQLASTLSRTAKLRGVQIDVFKYGRGIIKTTVASACSFLVHIPNNQVTVEEFTPFRCDDIQTVFVTKSSPEDWWSLECPCLTLFCVKIP